MNEVIPTQLVPIMKELEAYLVGGAVRDALLGKKIKDYDLATPFTPQKVTEKMKTAGFKVLPTGIDYGTVTVVVPKVGRVEVTTFRGENYKKEKGRKPEVWYVKNLTDDLERRDFTINALAMDWEEKIVDMCGGPQDLKDGIIRFVGNPEDRIEEDPLRMLRACRFAARYNFTIHEDDLEIIQEKANTIIRISSERITEEFRKSQLFMSKFFQNIMTCNLAYPIFRDKDILKFKELKHDQRGHHFGESIYDHTVIVLAELDRSGRTPFTVKMAGMFHDYGKVETYEEMPNKIAFHGHPQISTKKTEKILKEFKGLSKDDLKEIVWMIREHDRFPRILHQLHEVKLDTKRLTRIVIDYRLEGVKREWINDIVRLAEADYQFDFQELHHKALKVFDTPRPDGNDFLKYPEKERAKLIRDAWITAARRRLREL